MKKGKGQTDAPPIGDRLLTPRSIGGAASEHANSGGIRETWGDQGKDHRKSLEISA